MIYLFGTGKNVSVVMDGKHLTDAQKEKASVILGRLPKCEQREGYVAHLQVDPETHEVSYYYEKIV